MQADDRERLFQELYSDHQRPLHAYFLGRTNDPELAQDLVQELFLRAWRSVLSLQALRPERRPYWLYAAARNLVVDHYRLQDTRDRTQRKLAQYASPSAVDPPESSVLSDDSLRQLDAAIKRLPEDLRVALVLQVLGERTSSEIGEILGQPAGTVRYHLAQARRRLASELGTV
jgi:RNA polymerase sigma-70 factor (ECF subfamily)